MIWSIYFSCIYLKKFTQLWCSLTKNSSNWFASVGAFLPEDESNADFRNDRQSPKRAHYGNERAYLSDPKRVVHVLSANLVLAQT